MRFFNNSYFKQILEEQFRHRYSQMWLAVLNADQKGMQKWAAELGVDDKLFRLLACIMTAKPWEAVSRGIGKKTDKATHDKEVFCILKKCVTMTQ